MKHETTRHLGPSAFVLGLLLLGCQEHRAAPTATVDLGVLPEPLHSAPAKHEAFALHGWIANVEADAVALERGWLTVRDGVVVARESEPPEDVPTIDTDGLILPGLIDLHEHLSYAYHPRFHDTVFAGTGPTFSNRYAWQADERYAAFSARHYAMLSGVGVRDVFTAYGELRELVGGTTSVADAMRYSKPWQHTLARDVWSEALTPLGGGTFTTEVFFLDKNGVRADPPTYRIDPGFLERVATHDTVILHLCEGRPDDVRTRRELELFLGWAREHREQASKIILIHAVGIPGAAFQDLASVGVHRLVWSPYSNLDLYGCTADVAAAHAAGFTIALGTDWYPSGTDSLFDELRVAQLVLADEAETFPVEERVAMLVANASTMLGRPSGLGTLAVGAPADLIVIPREGNTLLDALLAADAETVQLVVVRGRPLFGRTDWMEALLTDVWSPDAARRSFAFDVSPIVAWIAAKVEQGFVGEVNAVPITGLGDRASVFEPGPRRKH